MKQTIFIFRCIMAVTLVVFLMACDGSGGASGNPDDDNDPDIVECVTGTILVNDECVDVCSDSNTNGYCADSKSCIEGVCIDICSTSKPDGYCVDGKICEDGACADICSSSKPNGYCADGKTCVSGSCIDLDSSELFLTKGISSYHDEYYRPSNRKGFEVKYDADGNIIKTTNVTAFVEGSDIKLEKTDDLIISYDNGKVVSVKKQNDLCDTSFEKSIVDYVAKALDIEAPKYVSGLNLKTPLPAIGTDNDFADFDVIDMVRDKSAVKKILKDPANLITIIENFLKMASAIETEPLMMIDGCYNEYHFVYDGDRLTKVEFKSTDPDYLSKEIFIEYSDGGRPVRKIIKVYYESGSVYWSNLRKLSYAGDKLTSIIDWSIYGKDIVECLEVADGQYSKGCSLNSSSRFSFYYDENGDLTKVLLKDQDMVRSQIMFLAGYDNRRLVSLDANLRYLDGLNAKAGFIYTETTVEGNVAVNIPADSEDEEDTNISFGYIYDMDKDEVKIDAKIPINMLPLGIDLSAPFIFEGNVDLRSSIYSGVVKGWLEADEDKSILASAKFSLEFNDAGRLTSMLLKAYQNDFDDQGSYPKEFINISKARDFDDLGRPVNATSSDGIETLVAYGYDDLLGEVVAFQSEDHGDGYHRSFLSAYRYLPDLEGGGELVKEDFLCGSSNTFGLCVEDGKTCNAGICQ